MKILNLKKLNLSLYLLLTLFVANGCYNETLDAIKEYPLQIPFNYASKGNRFTTRFNDTILYNASKLFNYTDGDKIYSKEEYQNNKNKIKNLEIYRLFVYIDSISAYDPNSTVEEKFTTVQSFIKFKDDEEGYRIHYMENVTLKELYRQSDGFTPYISQLDKATSDAISEKLLQQKPFQLYSYFTSYVGNRDFVDRLDFNISASLRLTLKTD